MNAGVAKYADYFSTFVIVMKRFIQLFLCLFLVWSCTSTGKQSPEPAVPQEEEGLALANLSVINMREQADYSAELGTQALMGTPVKVLGHDSYWARIETPDGYKAWVNDMAIAPVDSVRLAEWKASRRVIVTKPYTSFKSSPAADADPVSDAVWGDVAEYVSEAGGWTQVLLPDGRQAWILSDEVAGFRAWADSREALAGPDASEAELQKARELIVATARQFIGVPYLWGGTSIKGVDCSGFSKTVYFLNGYILLRNASQQYKTGEAVDISEGLDKLLPGDLVFFGREATADKPERMTHVSIYIGDGRIIHSSQMVRISSLVEGEPDYYDRKPLRACRIIGTQDSGRDVLSVSNGNIYF